MTRQTKRRTYRQHILERGLQEVAQLLLRDELEERRFERIVAGVIEELHASRRSSAGVRPICGANVGG